MFPGASVIVLLINLFILLLVIRGIFSWFPGMLYSDIGRMLVTGTEWFLGPIRRVIPPMGGLDISFIVAILILYALAAFIGSGDIVGTLIAVIAYALLLIVILLVVRVFFSFFRMDPWHPVVQIIMATTEPFARPFRSWLPRRPGQFDWAPVAALVTVFVVYELVLRIPRFTLG